MSRFEERLLRIGVLLFVVAGPVSAQTIYVSLESGRLQKVGAYPDGRGHTFRIINPRTFIFTTTFDL